MNKVFLKSEEELLRSLLADECKNRSILEDLTLTLKQLSSKSNFRIALINTLLEERGYKDKYNINK